MKRPWFLPKRGWTHSGEWHPHGSLAAQVEQLALELDNLKVQLWIAVLDLPFYRRFG